MGFGDDLRGELFDELGADNKKDPLGLIQQGDQEKEAGNHQKSKDLYEQAIQSAGSQVEKYTSQNQHRAAAEAYYKQVLGYGRLENEEKQNELYSRVVDELLEAANTAITFGEESRGFAIATIGGLVCLMKSDEERAYEIYSDFISKIEGKQNPEYLKKLLYSLGYLLDALKNNDVGALSDAQNFISTDLMPMLESAKLQTFEVLLRNVVNHTQDVLADKIKMPNLVISNTLPGDLQFNQVFDVGLRIVNEGDGVATDVELEVDIPEDIEILEGERSESFDQLSPQQELTREFSLRYLTGDTVEEETRTIKGSITYTDMLNNSHKQFFGPLTLEFKAVSRTEEFGEELEEIYSQVEEFDELYGLIPNDILTQFKESVEQSKDEIEALIENNEFEKVEFGLELLESHISWMKEFVDETGISLNIHQTIESKIDEEKESLQKELEEKFEEEKEEALEELRQKKEKEKDQELKDLQKQLDEENTKEINELKDKHNSELQEMQKSHESKLNKQLASLENKLREDFQEKIEKKNDEMESAIRDLQQEKQEAIEQTKEEMKEKLTNKYEQKIEELEDEMSEMKRKLTSRAEEEKQLELETLRDKLETEKKEALEQQERELRETISSKYETKIQDLERKIQELESSEDELNN